MLLLLATFFNDPAEGSRDFAARYAAGVALARGENPYDDRVVDRIEDQLTGVDAASAPFRDPPPVALLFRAIAAVPYDAAAPAWRVLMVACALGIGFMTGRLLGIPVRGAGSIALMVALTLAFSPVYDGINRVQVDPLYGLLATIGLLASRRWFGGALQALAALKPQTTLLATAGGLSKAPRTFAVSLAAGAAAIAGTTAAATTILAYDLRWSDWLDKARASSDQEARTTVAAALLLMIAAALAVVASRALVARGTDRGVATLAVAACVNGALGALILQYSHSLVLLIVPLALAVRAHIVEELPRAPQLLLGVVMGLTFGSAMFAVAYHSGRSHALVPIAITGLIAVACRARWRCLRFPLAVAFLVNSAVVVAALPPAAHEWLQVCVSILLVAHLASLALVSGARSRRSTSSADLMPSR